MTPPGENLVSAFRESGAPKLREELLPNTSSLAFCQIGDVSRLRVPRRRDVFRSPIQLNRADP
jgi:hypothetical protein